MGFVLANAITGHFDNAKTYIELGSGIGGMLFDIHGFTLNKVVSRSWWKFAGGALRAGDCWPCQAARSRVAGWIG